MKNEKKTTMSNVRQISKCFFGTFCLAQTLKLWSVELADPFEKNFKKTLMMQLVRLHQIVLFFWFYCTLARQSSITYETVGCGFTSICMYSYYLVSLEKCKNQIPIDTCGFFVCKLTLIHAGKKKYGKYFSTRCRKSLATKNLWFSLILM